MNTNDTSTCAPDTASLPAVVAAHRAMPATPSAIFELIEQMDHDIRFATSGEDLVKVHGEADYYRSVAKLRKLWRFQVAFSLRVADAERAIVRAFPALTPHEAAARRGRDDVHRPLPEGISSSTLSKMRGAHVALCDEAYLSICADAQRKGEILTRQKLTRAARKARVGTDSGPVERSPDHDIVEGIRRSVGALVSRHKLCGIVVVVYASPDEDPRCISKAAPGWVIDPSADAVNDAKKVFALCPHKGKGAPRIPSPRDAQKDYWKGLCDYYGERMRCQHRTPERFEVLIDCATAEKQARGLFKRKFDFWPSDKQQSFPFVLGLKAPSEGTRRSISRSWAVFREEKTLAKRLARENLASRPQRSPAPTGDCAPCASVVPPKPRTTPRKLSVGGTTQAEDLSALLAPFGSHAPQATVPFDVGVELGGDFDSSPQTEFGSSQW